MFAARAQNVEQWILPALARRQDRRLATASPIPRSPIKAPARGLGWETVLEVDRIACHGLVPDLTLCIDIDTETGLARAHSRNRNTPAERIPHRRAGDRVPRQGPRGLSRLARREPQRVRLIDGSGPEEEIADESVGRSRGKPQSCLKHR